MINGWYRGGSKLELATRAEEQGPAGLLEPWGLHRERLPRKGWDAAGICASATERNALPPTPSLSSCFPTPFLLADLRTVCPPGTFAHRDGNQWYCYKFYEDRLTFQEAEEECQFRWKGHLASLTSDTQAKLVGTYVAKENIENAYVWIGLQRTPTSDQNTGWRWTDGTRSRYTSWNRGEPNNATGKELCVFLLPHSGYMKWNDKNCDFTTPFLCKWKPS
ncbi:C-type lectin-like [Candoia aspera]|uniref:C-type lectin-like n=1 Tax=Candoia aspera TaxID=51853 RepID=UPI002FD81E3C